MFMPSRFRIAMMCRRRCRQRASQPEFIIQFRYIFKRHMQIWDINQAIFQLPKLLADRFLSLPIYAELRPEQVAEVVMHWKRRRLCGPPRTRWLRIPDLIRVFAIKGR